VREVDGDVELSSQLVERRVDLGAVGWGQPDTAERHGLSVPADPWRSRLLATEGDVDLDPYPRRRPTAEAH
jgi:hypothetical protein